MENKGLTIYLAGAMAARKDMGKRWRRNITPFLKRNGYASVFDPTVEESKYDCFLEKYKVESFKELKLTNKAGYSELMQLIESNDIELIRKSDHVLVYIDKAVFKSDGTISEIRAACEMGKPIFVVMKVGWGEVFGWTYWRLQRYANERGQLFYSFSDYKNYIKTLRGKNESGIPAVDKIFSVS